MILGEEEPVFVELLTFERPKFQIEHAVFLMQEKRMFLKSSDRIWEVERGRIQFEEGLSFVSNLF